MLIVERKRPAGLTIFVVTEDDQLASHVLYRGNDGDDDDDDDDDDGKKVAPAA